MSNSSETPKRKKSGAEFRKSKKAREENEKLGGFLLNYLKPKENEPCNPLESTKDLESKEEDAAIFSQNSTEVYVGTDSESTDVNNSDEHAADSNLDDDSVHKYPESENIGLQGESTEEAPEAVEPEVNRNVSIDKRENTFDPGTLVGLNLSISEKESLIRMNPCQPSEFVLNQRRRSQGDRSRYCSQQVFFSRQRNKAQMDFLLPKPRQLILHTMPPFYRYNV